MLKKLKFHALQIHASLADSKKEVKGGGSELLLHAKLQENLRN